MAIRQQTIYDRNTDKMLGYVDIGTGEDEEDLAKEVLVIMVVGLHGGWKAPVAFFFTKVISAETQTELLKTCILKLAENGFVIHSLTMDGHASNQAMCSLLGANIELTNLQTFFEV